MAYEQTRGVFTNRNQHFSNAVMAMLFLGDVALDEVIRSQKDNQKLFFSSVKVKVILRHQHNIVNTLKQGSTKGVRDSIRAIQRLLEHPDLNLSIEEQKKARALCYMQINLLSDGLFESYCNNGVEEHKDKAPKEASWFTSILNLLKQCVEWVFSFVRGLFSSIPDEETALEIDVDASVENQESLPTLSSPHARFFNSILKEIITPDSVISILNF